MSIFFHCGVLPLCPLNWGPNANFGDTLKNFSSALHRNLCPHLRNRVGAYACAAENVAVVEEQTLGQEGRPHIHHSTRQILRRTQHSVVHIPYRDLGLKCLKRCHVQELSAANCHGFTTPDLWPWPRASEAGGMQCTRSDTPTIYVGILICISPLEKPNT